MKQFKNEGALILCTLVWGGTFTATKLSLVSVSPSLFLGIRFAIASAVFLIYALLQKPTKEYREEAKQSRIWIPVLLGFWMFLGFACQTIGLKFTTATKSGFLTGTLVVITPILQTIFFRRIPNAGNLLGVIIVMLGLFFLSFDPEAGIGKLSFQFHWGDVITIGGAFFFSLYILLMDRVSREVSIQTLLLSQTLTTSILSFLLALGLDYLGLETLMWHWETGVLPALIYNGLISSVGTTFLQTKYQKAVTPTRAGLIFSLEPVFSAVIAYYTLGERMQFVGLLGCGLVMTGVLFAELFGSSKERVTKKED
ncbi:EamA-like transporter family protein [Leptospira fainei serovar Hurstbridge str. BUT 6]|uniref:EamA-like transporter family protein n=1 Tax=Leptospira fainei serovar Hurstbridge str. BUT 6 TaxID=1193011 RepID=S3VDI7_9LEPT|nr:DMT family transporter [Leptospira fainei]EPG74525.1 EamA-like transporter family protein [Leptospira fainei serovar Hurstbridge str. BUT 6]